MDIRIRGSMSNHFLLQLHGQMAWEFALVATHLRLGALASHGKWFTTIDTNLPTRMVYLFFTHIWGTPKIRPSNSVSCSVYRKKIHVCLETDFDSWLGSLRILRPQTGFVASNPYGDPDTSMGQKSPGLFDSFGGPPQKTLVIGAIGNDNEFGS